MAFQFSLATVLRVRLLREEREERLLQRIFHEMAHAHQSIANLKEQLLQISAGRVAQVADLITARDLHLFATVPAALYECKRQLESELEKLELLKESQMLIYQAARRERETVSDLRTKKLLIYRASLVAGEQKRLDDNFNARHHRTVRL